MMNTKLNIQNKIKKLFALSLVTLNTDAMNSKTNMNQLTVNNSTIDNNQEFADHANSPGVSLGDVFKKVSDDANIDFEKIKPSDTKKKDELDNAKITWKDYLFSGGYRKFISKPAGYGQIVGGKIVSEKKAETWKPVTTSTLVLCGSIYGIYYLARKMMKEEPGTEEIINKASEDASMVA